MFAQNLYNNVNVPCQFHCRYFCGEEKRGASELVTHHLSVKEVLRSWYLYALSPRRGLKEQTAV